MPEHTVRVTVVGGGLMGRGISAALARAGVDVAVVEPDARTADVVRAEAVPNRRIADLDEAVPTADVVIEAVTEDPAVKSALWRRLGELATDDAVLASNTSSLRIDDLAAVVPRPERVAGMHWFTPAELVPCVEVVRGSATSHETVQTIMALARRAAKIPTTVADAPGFVANRLQFALLAEALRCVDEGVATPAQVDEIVRTSFGPRLAVLGPFANADLGGLDVYAEILRQLHERLGARYPDSGTLHALADAGRLGVKSGAGFASYTPESAGALRAYRDAVLGEVIGLVASRAPALDGGPWGREPQTRDDARGEGEGA